MDVYMRKATADFINERVNHYGKNETDSVRNAFLELQDYAEQLQATLTKEQLRLFRAVENAYRVADGESIRFYWKGGFGDAIQLLIGWASNGDAEDNPH